MTRRYVLAIGLALFFLCTTPQPVAAQTNSDAEFRATLLALIEALQQQISALQRQLDAQLADQQPEASFREVHDHDHLDEPYEILETYTVAPGVTTIAVGNDTYEDFFERLLELTPAQYRPNLTHILVFDGDRRSSDAYVRGKKYSDGRFSWHLGVSDEFLDEDVSSESQDELIVHELAHIISLAEALDPGAGHTCHEALASRESCPNPNSIYGQFVEEFWPERLLDLLADEPSGFRADQYSRYDDWFVSSYASTHPAEDFAETYMIYVTGMVPDVESSITDQKINFMDRFTSLRLLRQEIRRNL